MIFVDQTALFKRRFERTAEGYLYFPSHKGGGKLLTEAEFDSLVADHRRWVGTRFRPGLLFWLMFGALLSLACLSVFFELPEIVLDCGAAFLAVVFIAAMIWKQSAPYRFFRNRPDTTPPRTKPEMLRASRAMLPWPILIWMVLISGVVLFASIATLMQSPSVGSILLALFFVLVLVGLVRLIGQKIGDGRR